MQVSEAYKKSKSDNTHIALSEIMVNLKKEKSFFSYLIIQKKLLFISSVLYILQFAIMKWALPMTDIYMDGNAYIYVARKNFSINMRPIGFPQYLRFFHHFSNSTTVYATLNYLYMAVASLFVFFSIDYLLKFRNSKIKLLTFLCVVINPLLVFMSNQIASDSIFTALSIVWITLLFWYLKKPHFLILLLQFLILGAAFWVRYNALYYPIAGILICLLSPKLTWRYKLSYIFLACLFTLGTIRYETQQNYKTTGAKVFSAFSGWQLANNALYVYKHIKPYPIDSVFGENQELIQLNKYATAHVNIEDDIKPALFPQDFGIGYLWGGPSPLNIFKDSLQQAKKYETEVAYFKSSIYFQKFATKIALHYPKEWVRYAIFPNSILFLFPPSETLLDYQVDSFGVSPSTTKFFPKMTATSVQPRWRHFQKTIIAPYPILHAVLTILSLALPSIFIIKKVKKHKKWKAIFPAIAWLILFLGNMCFSILSAYVVLRYEAVWFVLDFIIIGWTLDQLLFKNKV